MPAIDVMRPPPAAGPRLRNLNARSRSVVSSSLLFSAVFSAAGFSGAASFSGASNAGAAMASDRQTSPASALFELFISLLFWLAWIISWRRTRGQIYAAVDRDRRIMRTARDDAAAKCQREVQDAGSAERRSPPTSAPATDGVAVPRIRSRK